MSELQDQYQQAGNAGTGDELSMGELLGKTFQIVSIDAIEISDSKFPTKEGNARLYQWTRADIIVEEEEGAYEARSFFHGGRVIRVLQWMMEEDNLPQRVTLVRRPDLLGNPWDLEPVEAGTLQAQQTQEVPSKAKAAPTQGRGKILPQKPTVDDKTQFLLLLPKAKDAIGKDAVLALIANLTAETAPKFLCYKQEGDEGKVKPTFDLKAIDVGQLVLVNQALEKAAQPEEEIPFE